MRIAISLLFPLLLMAAAQAGENTPCFKCKLYGACPLPDFATLSRCLAARLRKDEPPGPAVSGRPPPSPADGSGWITTPCGRIRATR